jgi:hypothetical protein
MTAKAVMPQRVQDGRVHRVAHHRAIARQQQDDEDQRRGEDAVDDGRGEE